MPQIINIETVTPQVIELRVQPPEGEARIFRLADDIPDIIGFMTLKLPELEQALTEEGLTFEEIGQRWAAYDEATTHVCGEIFRHSYPGMTDEELAKLFSFQQRRDIVKLFFTVLMPRLKQRPDDTPTTELEQAIAAQLQVMTPANEQQPTSATRQGGTSRRKR